ncbi:MAG: alpha/beta fold hydrolase [Deltaproteobacteria bacterium]|nr:alpha/beta fold hydrolase [Deltaproteobacteria bacterium]
MNSTRLLRYALRANALFSAATGVAMVASVDTLPHQLDLPAPLLQAVGSLLVGYGLALGLLSVSRHVASRWAVTATAMDLGWVIGSAALLAFHPVPRAELVGVTALAVLAVALLQLAGLRRAGFWAEEGRLAAAADRGRSGSMTHQVDWSFSGTWPYSPRWFETMDGHMHYVDEGPRSGRPVVLVHGNPTWGYLYRNFIPPLVAAGFRVIVADHLGFGRSDKPDAIARYTIELHARRLEALLESLDLRDATLGVQDWGGPTGLSWATRHSERVRSLVIMNSFAHRPPKPVSLPLPLRLFRTPGLGELLVKGLHAFVHLLVFRAGVVHPDRLTAPVRAAYLAPHPTWASRTAVLAFPRSIPNGPVGPVSDFLEDVHVGLAAFRAKPVFIAWAMKDIGFTPDLLEELWLGDFPGAEVLRLPDAGHYLQEDAHELIVPAMIDFLQRT